MATTAGFLRRHRTGLASACVVLAAAGAVVAYALAADGYQAHHADLNDGGVWVTNGELGLFGRLNKPVNQLDGGVTSLSAGSGSVTIDVLQDGAAVVADDQAKGQLYPLDPTGLSAHEDSAVERPAAGNAAIGGGTLALLDRAHGTVRALTFDPDQPLTSIAGLTTGTPIARVGTDAAMTVGQDGTVYAVSADRGLTVVHRTATGFARAQVTTVGGLSGDTLQVAAVGSTPMILAVPTGGQTATAVVPGHAPVPLPSAGDAVLQQSGPGDTAGLVATGAKLLSVPLAGGSARTLSAAGSGGVPAAPVRLAGCVFAAWPGGDGTVYSQCGDAGPRTAPLGVPSTALAYRVNHQMLLLNDLPSGRTWNVDSGTPQQVADWTTINRQSRTDKSKKQKDDTETSQRQTQPPVAATDDLGARPGRVTPLYVLDNDSDPSRGVLAIDRIDGSPQVLREASIAPDGQTIDLRLPANATGDTDLTYVVRSTSGRTARGVVTVHTRTPEQNAAPVPRVNLAADVHDWHVPQGGTVTIPVLQDWRDYTDGDTTVLTSAKVGNGTVTATPDGGLVYSAPSAAGKQRIDYTISDGHGKTVPGSVQVTVDGQDATSQAPTPRPDYATGRVGYPISVSPLLNDLPGSDPATPDATLQLGGAVTPEGGADVSTNVAGGVVTVTPRHTGDIHLTYRVVFGTARPVTSTITIHPIDTHDDVPITAPDITVLHGTAPVLVDVLANDSDPSGNLLGVVSAAAPSDGSLQVAVVDSHWLRINARQDPTGPQTADLQYTVSNGTQSAIGDVLVTELPHLAADPPVTMDDTATVREGQSTLIPVLDNDTNAGGDPITLVQDVGGSVPSGQLPVTTIDGTSASDLGSAYVSGNLVRYVAPTIRSTRPREVRIIYTAQSAGASADGTITVTITPPYDAKLNPDQSPTPTDLDARVVSGGTVRIAVPTYGVDPDGDVVTVQGLGSSVSPAPQLGRLLKYSANSLTYEAYPFDGNGGTDQFVYTVSDAYGRTQTATVRVAVLQPDLLPPVVPHQIDVTAAPGEHLRLHVVTPAHIDYPEGAAPTLVDPSRAGQSQGGAVRLDSVAGFLDVDVPDQSQTGTFSAAYTVTSALGDRTSAGIEVTLKKSWVTPPSAVDHFPTLKPGATTVSVDLLQGDADPDGRPLTVRAPTARVSGSTLSWPVTQYPQVVPYVISSASGARASANVYIPAGAGGAPYWNGKTISFTGASTVVDVRDYVTDPEKRPVQLFLKEKVWASPSAGLAQRDLDATRIRLTAGRTGSKVYNGPAALSFIVLGGSAAGPSGQQTAVITVPVQVGTPSPELRCPVAAQPVQQGKPDGTTLPVAALCHVWSPDPSALASLTYHLSWAPSSSIPNVSFTDNDSTRPVLLASHNAQPGRSGKVLIRAAGSSSTGVLNVDVVTAPLLTVSPIAVQGVLAGSTRTFDLASHVTSPFGFSTVSVVSATRAAGSAANVGHGRGSITVRPDPGTHGSIEVDYVVTDVDSTSDRTRQVTGTITLQVIDKPGAPAGVNPQQGLLSGAAIVNWGATAANGAPIDQFRVRYRSNKGDSGVQSGFRGSPARVTGLRNGQKYTFQVEAHNAAGWGPPGSSSSSVEPDVRAPVVKNVQPSNPQDRRITLSWNKDVTTGSAVDAYRVQYNGTTQLVPGGATTVTLTRGLTNEKTLFSVFAHNDAGWNTTPGTGTGQPAGKPVSPSRLSPQYYSAAGSGERAVSLTWTAGSANGQGPPSYTVTRSPGGPVTCPEGQSSTTCTDQHAPAGTTYTYSVTETNLAGRTSPRNHVSNPASTTFEVASTPHDMDTPTLSTVSADDPDGTATVNFTTAASYGKELNVNCAYATGGDTPTKSSPKCPGQQPWGGYSPAGGQTDHKTISGLGNGVTVRVVLWEDNGTSNVGSGTNGQSNESNASAPSSPVTVNGPPSMPPSGTCSGGSTFNVNWAAATPAGARTITSYRIALDGGGQTDIGNRLDYQFTQRPTDSNPHTVNVWAYDGHDQSAQSLDITGCKDPDPPPPPASITATDGGNGTHQPGTCSGKCHTLNFTVHNFTAGRYSWQCNNASGVYYNSADHGYTIAVGSEQTFSGNTLDYCESTNDTVWITINGVDSTHAYLGSG